MSKLRSKSPPGSKTLLRSRLQSLLQKDSRKNYTTIDTTMNTRIYQQTRCKTLESDTHEVKKEKIFHKNINAFRDSFQEGNPSMLPFLASLRKIKDYRGAEVPKGTSIEPFNAERQTANQKIKKSINDFKAHPFRLSKVFYRWNKRSGLGIKEVCDFECSLRMDHKRSSLGNPEASTFNNTITPIHLKTVETPKYKQSSLICQRQKRLFTLQS